MGASAPGTPGGSSGSGSDASKPNAGATSNGGSQGTQVIDEAAAENANHAEAEAASKDGVLTLPQTGDEKGLVFAVILLVSGVAAVGGRHGVFARFAVSARFFVVHSGRQSSVRGSDNGGNESGTLRTTLRATL